jgi:hypothetical protein
MSDNQGVPFQHYRIVISTNSIEISSHDRDWVEKKEKEYAKHLNGLREQGPSASGIAPIQEKRGDEQPALNLKIGQMPPNEFYRSFIHAKNIRSRPDIATFFVYYLSRVKGLEEITSSVIREQFRAAQYPAWNKINIADVLSRAKKKAFLNSVGNNWSLTITGEDFVLNTISE